MPDTPFATGRCLCGAVNYELKAEPARMAACHCKDCQRSSGTGHMSLAFFKASDVSIHGDMSAYDVTADSGNVNTRHFCATCGSRLMATNSARPDFVGIAVGCADDNSWFSPHVVVFNKRCADWDVIPLEIPKFDEMPPPPK